MIELNNKYYILRHGEAVSNVKNIVSSWPEKFRNPLTNKGREQIKKSVKKLKGKHIDLIFSSDLLRARQTAEIIDQGLKIKPKFDKKLRELNFGIFNSKSIHLNSYFENKKDLIKKNVPKGESYEKVLKRMYVFLKDIDKKHKGKNILIISHEGPLWVLKARVNKIPLLRALKIIPEEGQRIKNGEVKELN